MYKTNWLCSILFWDKFLDLYMGLYGTITREYILFWSVKLFNCKLIRELLKSFKMNRGFLIK